MEPSHDSHENLKIVYHVKLYTIKLYIGSKLFTPSIPMRKRGAELFTLFNTLVVVELAEITREGISRAICFLFQCSL